MKEINPAASAKLDLVRALTAWAVAANHIRGLFFADYAAVVGSNIFVRVIYFLTGFGHQGVIIFFVLSGLLIGGSVIRSLKTSKWSWSAYAGARLSRLYVVLVPGLILTWLLDSVGIGLTRGQDVYAGSSVFGNIITFSVASAQNFKNFFGSLFFVQSILTQTFGSNTPLWSLANEFWYYLLFPLCIFIFWKNKNIVVRAACAVVAAVILVFVGWNIASLFLVWLFGVAVAVLSYEKVFSPKQRLVWGGLAAIQFLTVVSAARLSLFHNDLLADIVLGLSVAVFLWSIMNFSMEEFSGWFRSLSKELAGFSYTLYVVHLPFLIFINGLVNTKTNYFLGGRWTPDATHLVWGLVIFIVLLLYAYVIAMFTEKRTSLVRKWVGNWWRGNTGRQRFNSEQS